MPTLAIPASISKKKQACQSCRQRKKRCDGERPTCSLCRKWGIACQYTTAAGVGNFNNHDRIAQPPDTLIPGLTTTPLDYNFEQQSSFNLMQLPGMNFDIQGPSTVDFPITNNGYPTPRSGLDALIDGTEFENQNFIGGIGLPSGTVLEELINLFFENLYDEFPCFHRARFMAELHDGPLQTEVPIILYAMCCLSARLHPDPSIKSCANDWYEQAKFLYELTRRDPRPGLRILQAVICLVSYASTIGDFSASWLFLGKAWRQCVALRMHCMDSTYAVSRTVNRLDVGVDHGKEAMLEILEAGKSIVEREEYRRALWLLFIMDRNSSWPTAWPNAIDERHFKVDMPLANCVFQAMDPSETVGSNSCRQNVPFTRSLNSLITATAPSANAPLNLFHYLAVAHVLLGRVTEQVHSLHSSPNTQEYADECNELDAHLVKFKLTLPRAATSLLDASLADRSHVVWLNAVLNNMDILLHYRCASNTASSTITNDALRTSSPDSHSHFQLAVQAALNSAALIKSATRISTDLLLSNHIVSALYVAACVLVIQWRLSSSPTTSSDSSTPSSNAPIALKNDIDLFMLVFERMNDVWRFLGLKYKIALEHELNKSRESIESLRDRGFRGLLADCSKWGYVKEEVERLGLAVAIT